MDFENTHNDRTDSSAEQAGSLSNSEPSSEKAPPPSTGYRDKGQKKLGCLGIVGLVVIIGGLCLMGLFIVVIALGILMPSGTAMRSGKITEETVQSQRGAKGKIAVLEIAGIIHADGGLDNASVQTVTSQLDRAISDPAVRAVVLEMNTPGGGVTASDEIYHAVRKVKNHNIPVVTCMRSVCASGGYYIASAADHIVASPTTMTGSIGVLIPQISYTELLDKVGVKKQPVTSGEMKNMFSGGVERNAEQKEKRRQYIQGLVDQTFKRFLRVVVRGRSEYDSIQDAENAQFADGRVLLAADAKEQGLVDQLGYFDNAVKKARELGNAPKAKVIRYKKTLGLSDFLRTFTAEKSIKVETELMPPLTELSPYKFYYLMPRFK